MKEFNIVTLKFLDDKTDHLMVGGVQTYIRDLALLAIDKGYKVYIYQLESKLEKVIEYEGMIVYSRRVKSEKNQIFFDTLYKEHNHKESVFIIATDQMNIKSKEKNVITIQHGIAFDIPGTMIPGLWGRNKLLQHINKLLRCISNVRRFYMSRNTVCVDYNYYNWFRTLGTIYPGKCVTVIPNYVSGSITIKELNDKLLNRTTVKKILFARRFCDYRGAFLFVNVIKRLLQEYPELDVTFAGEGPLEGSLKDNFKEVNNIHFTKFSAPESITFHKLYDISVVPTIYSEGTSLSLIEAMAAGCFPIATHVGGMTNIILDCYNGKLCSPDEESLYNSVKEALNMPRDKFNYIVENAYSSAVSSFSINIWRERWSYYIDSVMSVN